METYLFTWNPKRWQWDDLEDAVQEINELGTYLKPWSCGNTRRIKTGDRAYLIKIGQEEPKGIIGSGYIRTEPYESEHYTDTGKSAMAVIIEFDQLFNPYKDPILAITHLQDGDLSAQKWTPEASGISIRPELIDSLEKTWFNFLQRENFRCNPLLPNVQDANQYLEGDDLEIKMTRYERNPFARAECIKHYGLSCVVCGFNFETVYGSLGKEFIHVHHLNQIAYAGGQYRIDPINDLRPVCPNCHAMLHRKKTALSIDELRSLLNSH